MSLAACCSTEAYPGVSVSIADGASPALYLADPDICQRRMYIAYPRNKYLSQASKELIRILKESNGYA